MKRRNSLSSKGLFLGLAAVLISSCVTDGESEKQSPQMGQSGSEFTPPVEGEGGSENSRDIKACPCEHLAGALPLSGEVVSWSSSVLTLEVTAVPLDTPPADAPEIGDVVQGIYYGELPCQRGSFLPSPGDEVVGYLLRKEAVQPQCCTALACGDTCADSGGALSTDECLSECQRPAQESCAEDFGDIEILGEFTLGPVAEDGVLLGRTGEESVVAQEAQLQLVFEGGASCTETFGEAQDRIQGAGGESFEGGLWKQSCSEE